MSYIEQHGYLCLQIVWHFSHSQMTVGVLGYPLPFVLWHTGKPGHNLLWQKYGSKKSAGICHKSTKSIHKYCERRSFLSVKIPIKIHGD